MTTASTGVAVIATDVAQTDRRALSEAWYSALHLADNARPPQPPRATTKLATTPASPTQRAPHAPQVGGEGRPPLSSRASRGTAIPPPSAQDRRQPTSASSRRIERAVVTLSARRPVPAAHTVDVDGGRVRLLVHTDGRRTRIVAVCSSPLRDVVERALASARFTLAGAGLAVGAP
jgi:hypothetical protein